MARAQFNPPIINEPTPIDYEKHAKAFGWGSVEDAEDDTLLVVAHDDLDVHFDGPNAWRDAVKWCLANQLFYQN